jgi:hypothetical protein
LAFKPFSLNPGDVPDGKKISHAKINTILPARIGKRY